MTGDLARLRVHPNPRVGPNVPDRFYCPECGCRKSGHVTEANGVDDCCARDGACACHAAILCHTITCTLSTSGEMLWARCAPCKWGAGHRIADADDLWFAVASHVTGTKIERHPAFLSHPREIIVGSTHHQATEH